MNERKRRIGENEAIFRSVNEQVRELTETLATATGTMKVVCECGARSCTDQFEITTDAYAQVRADSTLFVVNRVTISRRLRRSSTRTRSSGLCKRSGDPRRDRTRDGPGGLVRYLEPGRKRPRPRATLTRLLWLFAAAIALVVIIEAMR